MDRLRYNELALAAMRWAAVKPATRDAVAQVNRCVEEMQKLRGHTAPPVDRRGTLTMNTLEEQDRAEDLRKAYAARRDEIAPTDADLAELIAEHNVHLAPYDAIVYARIDRREVGVKYSAVGGDKAKAVRLAVRKVLRLVGVAQ